MFDRLNNDTIWLIWDYLDITEVLYFTNPRYDIETYLVDRRFIEGIDQVTANLNAMELAFAPPKVHSNPLDPVAYKKSVVPRTNSSTVAVWQIVVQR